MALFTAEEAQEFVIGGETPLSNYTDDQIEAAEERIRERFEDICEVAFEPTEVTVMLNRNGSSEIVLPNTRVTEIDEVTVDGTAVEVEDIKLHGYGVLYYAPGWGRGIRDVEVTYTHGHAEPPKAIKWAALIVAVDELTGSDTNKRATSHSDDLGTFRLSVPDGDKERWYGIPAVDAILQQYSEKVPASG